MNNMKNITVVGTGVIGNDWITRLLANRYNITASDPDEKAESRTTDTVSRAWSKMEKMIHAKGASQDNQSFETDLAKAVANADFIQENVPEREALKQTVIAEIDKHAPAETVIASSTSGILPTVLQEKCTNHPERMLVAHPFNPVYLMPLVELV